MLRRAALRDLTDSYSPALGACATLEAIAAIVVLLGPGGALTDPRAQLSTPPGRA
jgi:hypothetical protein